MLVVARQRGAARGEDERGISARDQRASSLALCLSPLRLRPRPSLCPSLCLCLSLCGSLSFGSDARTRQQHRRGQRDDYLIWRVNEEAHG